MKICVRVRAVALPRYDEIIKTKKGVSSPFCSFFIFFVLFGFYFWGRVNFPVRGSRVAGRRTPRTPCAGAADDRRTED